MSPGHIHFSQVHVTGLTVHEALSEKTVGRAACAHKPILQWLFDQLPYMRLPAQQGCSVTSTTAITFSPSFRHDDLTLHIVHDSTPVCVASPAAHCVLAA
jgi:hypothetical protein